MEDGWDAPPFFCPCDCESNVSTHYTRLRISKSLTAGFDSRADSVLLADVDVITVRVDDVPIAGQTSGSGGRLSCRPVMTGFHHVM